MGNIEFRVGESKKIIPHDEYAFLNSTTYDIPLIQK